MIVLLDPLVVPVWPRIASLTGFPCPAWVTRENQKRAPRLPQELPVEVENTYDPDRPDRWPALLAALFEAADRR